VARWRHRPFCLRPRVHSPSSAPVGFGRCRLVAHGEGSLAICTPVVPSRPHRVVQQCWLTPRRGNDETGEDATRIRPTEANVSPRCARPLRPGNRRRIYITAKHAPRDVDDESDNNTHGTLLTIQPTHMATLPRQHRSGAPGLMGSLHGRGPASDPASTIHWATIYAGPSFSLCRRGNPSKKRVRSRMGSRCRSIGVPRGAGGVGPSRL